MACGGPGWTGDGWRDEEEEDKTGRGRGKPVKGGEDRDEEEDVAEENGSLGQVGQDGDRADGKAKPGDPPLVEGSFPLGCLAGSAHQEALGLTGTTVERNKGQRAGSSRQVG